MRHLFALFAVLYLTACQAEIEADYLIENGMVYVGDKSAAGATVIAIRGDRIIYVGEPNKNIDAAQVIDASGYYVLPGFIDPHTHSIEDLASEDEHRRRNLNYQTQGVTTVFNGNDGFGDPDIQGQGALLSELGIGTNTAFFVGHGQLREQVMGGDKRAPTAEELREMENLIDQAMQNGALGLSTGLFYAPGSFAETQEVISLAKIAAEYEGVYDSHIRDESTYTVGLLPAIDEVLDIAREADIRVHIAHIKALGVDVWGASAEIIAKVQAAQAEGLRVTADQYPWQASGTRISNAIIPRWVKAGGDESYQSRLTDPDLSEKIRAESAENLRKRGGPEAILITGGQDVWINKTLQAVAQDYGQDPVDMALFIARNGDARIASFNMHAADVERFMVEPWVMTSSDGSTGHPRKYASYPKKYRDYVIDKGIVSIEDFIYRNSGLVAETFGICDRGFLRTGFKADIAIIDPETFKANADFTNANKISSGVTHLFVNGIPVIQDGEPQAALPGQVLMRCRTEEDPNAQ